MKKKVIAGILALTLAFSLTACGNDQKEDKKESAKTEQQDETEDEEDIEEEDVEEEVEEEKAMVEPGTIEGNVYTNASLGIQATIPEGYVLYTDEQIQEVLGAGKEMLENADYDVSALEESGTLYEVMAVSEDQTANIQIAIENTEVSTGMELEPEEYAQLLRTNILTTYQANGFSADASDVTEKNLGGLDWQWATVSFEGLTQEYYLTKIDGYIVAITVTYPGTTSEAIQQFLDSITAI